MWHTTWSISMTTRHVLVVESGEWETQPTLVGLHCQWEEAKRVDKQGLLVTKRERFEYWPTLVLCANDAHDDVRNMLRVCTMGVLSCVFKCV